MALVPVLKPLHLFGIIIFKPSAWNRWEGSDWFNVCRNVVGRSSFQGWEMGLRRAKPGVDVILSCWRVQCISILLGRFWNEQDESVPGAVLRWVWPVQ